MKPYFTYLIILISAFTTSTLHGQQASEWISLFDGKTTDSLRGYKMSGFPNEAWTAEDGALVAQRGVIEGLKVI